MEKVTLLVFFFLIICRGYTLGQHSKSNVPINDTHVEFSFQYNYFPWYKYDGQKVNDPIHSGKIGIGARFKRLEWYFLNFSFSSSSMYRLGFSLFDFTYRLRKLGHRFNPAISVSLFEAIWGDGGKDNKGGYQSSLKAGFDLYLSEIVILDINAGVSTGSALGTIPFANAGLKFELFK